MRHVRRILNAWSTSGGSVSESKKRISHAGPSLYQELAISSPCLCFRFMHDELNDVVGLKLGKMITS